MKQFTAPIESIELTERAIMLAWSIQSWTIWCNDRPRMTQMSHAPTRSELMAMDGWLRCVVAAGLAG
jgi:hypothetical protein